MDAASPPPRIFVSRVVAFEMKYLGALEKVSYQLIINPIWIFIDS